MTQILLSGSQLFIFEKEMENGSLLLLLFVDILYRKLPPPFFLILKSVLFPLSHFSTRKSLLNLICLLALKKKLLHTKTSDTYIKFET